MKKLTNHNLIKLETELENELWKKKKSVKNCEFKNDVNNDWSRIINKKNIRKRWKQRQDRVESQMRAGLEWSEQ